MPGGGMAFRSQQAPCNTISVWNRCTFLIQCSQGNLRHPSKSYTHWGDNLGDIFLGNLTALFIKSAPPGKHEDGDGLRLIKREDGGGQWVFRYTIYGRRREMGLGGLKALSLKDARDLASEYRTLVAKGKDPIEHRRKQRQEAMRSRYLLKDIALDAFESRKADLKGDGAAGRWYSPLEHHVL